MRLSGGSTSVHGVGSERSEQRQTMALLHWNRSTGLGEAATKTSAREARMEAELLCSGGVVHEEEAAVDELPLGTGTGTRQRGWSRNWSSATLFPAPVLGLCRRCLARPLWLGRSGASIQRRCTGSGCDASRPGPRGRCCSLCSGPCGV
jgi:hypothetical protein